MGLAIDAFAKLHMLHGLKAGPDSIAYLDRRADAENNRYRTDLMLYKPDTAKTTALTQTGDVKDYWWAQNGDIIYAGESEKDAVGTCLRRVCPATGDREEFLHLPFEVEDIVFLSPANFLFTGTPVNRQEKGSARICTELPFRRNGQGYTGGERTGLYLAQEGGVKALTGPYTQVEALRLSPEGDAAYIIACTYQDVQPQTNQLMRCDLKAGALTDLSPGEEYEHQNLCVLPGGRLLVQATNHKPYGATQNGALYLLEEGAWRPVNNGEAICADNSVLTDCTGPSHGHWALQDEDNVLLVETRRAQSNILRVDCKAGQICPVTDASGAVQEVAVLHGQTFMLAMRGVQAIELYRVKNDGTEKRLTACNHHAMEGCGIQKPELIKYKDADGRAHTGWVLLPEKEPAKKERVPAVLYVHGGPKAAYSPVLFHEFQFLASLGYAVLYCNPPGSEGYGEAYADIRGLYGTVDFEHLMLFLDAAVASCPLDESRLAIAGGSYGGFMVNWAITHTGRFCAAISERGIANWVSFVGTSDIGYFFGPDQMGVDMQDAEQLWRQSPLAHAQGCKTPTLFLHAEEDYRCYMDEATQMFTALKRQGVPAKLCLFPGENHEMSRSGKPKARIERLQLIAVWLGQYLGPAK